ncbi:hypothetical protein TNCV_49461 [Trichonephila clavipes]|nr:hypothetical protein TNCV_49461 [Trichonephila clavipes]
MFGLIRRNSYQDVQLFGSCRFESAVYRSVIWQLSLVGIQQLSCENEIHRIKRDILNFMQDLWNRPPSITNREDIYVILLTLHDCTTTSRTLNQEVGFLQRDKYPHGHHNAWGSMDWNLRIL